MRLLQGVLGERVAFFHGKMANGKKDKVINDFMDNKVDVVVATTAFGMGFDKPNVGKVINFGSPLSVEEYAQQVCMCMLQL